MDAQAMTQAPDDLEALLASLTAAEAAETSDPEVDAILEAREAEEKAELAQTSAEELDEALLADLEATVARAEVYEAQEAGADAVSAEPVKTKEAKTKKVKAANATPTTRTPRKTLEDLSHETFQITEGVAHNKAAVIATRPAQVKIAEKFDNLFLAIAAGKEPSGYVVAAMKVLSKTGTMTSADLVAAYKANGLKDGTARSQTGQIMELFNVTGIALRSGQSLTMRADSTIAKKLMATINAPTATA